MNLVDVNQFDPERLALLIGKIKLTKSNYDNEFTTSSDCLLKGSRYNDDERIARIIVGDIYGECKFDLKAAKSKFLSLTSTEVEPYIRKAVLESASADYHYTYEKVW